jgi:hypothetical protein
MNRHKKGAYFTPEEKFYKSTGNKNPYDPYRNTGNYLKEKMRDGISPYEEVNIYLDIYKSKYSTNEQMKRAPYGFYVINNAKPELRGLFFNIVIPTWAEKNNLNPNLKYLGTLTVDELHSDTIKRIEYSDMINDDEEQNPEICTLISKNEEKEIQNKILLKKMLQLEEAIQQNHPNVNELRREIETIQDKWANKKNYMLITPKFKSLVETDDPSIKCSNKFKRNPNWNQQQFEEANDWESEYQQIKFNDELNMLNQTYCVKQNKNEKTCISSKPNFETSVKQLCDFTPGSLRRGTWNNSCVINPENAKILVKDREMHYDNCMYLQSCMTDAGFETGIPKYFRPYMKGKYFPNAEKDIPICCKRSVKAVFEQVLTTIKLERVFGYKPTKIFKTEIIQLGLPPEVEKIIIKNHANDEKYLNQKIQTEENISDGDEIFYKSIGEIVKKHLEKDFEKILDHVGDLMISQKKEATDADEVLKEDNDSFFYQLSESIKDVFGEIKTLGKSILLKTIEIMKKSAKFIFFLSGPFVMALKWLCDKIKAGLCIGVSGKLISDEISSYYNNIKDQISEIWYGPPGMGPHRMMGPPGMGPPRMMGPPGMGPPGMGPSRMGPPGMGPPGMGPPGMTGLSARVCEECESQFKQTMLRIESKKPKHTFQNIDDDDDDIQNEQIRLKNQELIDYEDEKKEALRQKNRCIMYCNEYTIYEHFLQKEQQRQKQQLPPPQSSQQQQKQQPPQQPQQQTSPQQIQKQLILQQQQLDKIEKMLQSQLQKGGKPVPQQPGQPVLPNLPKVRPPMPMTEQQTKLETQIQNEMNAAEQKDMQDRQARLLNSPTVNSAIFSTIDGVKDIYSRLSKDSSLSSIKELSREKIESGKGLLRDKITNMYINMKNRIYDLPLFIQFTFFSTTSYFRNKFTELWHNIVSILSSVLESTINVITFGLINKLNIPLKETASTFFEPVGSVISDFIYQKYVLFLKDTESMYPNLQILNFFKEWHKCCLERILFFDMSHIKISIKLEDKIISIECKSSDTIGAIKEKIQEKAEIDADQQILTFDNTVLDSDPMLGYTLAKYEVKNDSTIVLTTKPRAPAPAPGHVGGMVLDDDEQIFKLIYQTYKNKGLSKQDILRLNNILFLIIDNTNPANYNQYHQNILFLMFK